MQVIIKVTDQLIDDVMANYPEAGAHGCLKCTGWKYKDCKFDFVDDENGKKYKLGRAQLRKGMKILLQQLADNKLPGLSLSLNTIHDAGNWDALCSDALVQCALLGDVIYGKHKKKRKKKLLQRVYVVTIPYDGASVEHSRVFKYKSAAQRYIDRIDNEEEGYNGGFCNGLHIDVCDIERDE